MAKVRKSTIEKVASRIDYAELKSLGIESYDIDNAYPQRVKDIFQDSGTAMTCLRMYERFVRGRGVSNEDFGKQFINASGLTVNGLLRLLTPYKGRNGGFAVHVNYNGLGDKVSAYFVPFEYCRLTLQSDEENPNMIAVNADWTNRKGKKPTKENTDYIHKYAPNEVLAQVESIDIGDTKGMSEEEILSAKWAKYKGQIFYWTPNGVEYPLSPADSVLEDMQTEAQTKRFKFGSSARNFLASHVIVTGVEEQQFDDEGNPIESDSDSMGDVVSEFQGADGSGGIVHVEVENQDDVFKIEKLDIQNYDGLYEYTEGSCSEDIVRQFLIPPVLLMQTPGKLAASSEIADAKEYYNELTQQDREDIEEFFEELFKGWARPINKSGDYSIRELDVNKPIPKDYAEYFTEDEIRASLGYDPKEPSTIQQQAQ